MARQEITEQLRQQILSGMHLGRWGPGHRLPSTRTLAKQFGVDQRRVTRAYHDLVMDGLVDLRPRSGFYVANGATPQPRLPSAAEWAVEALASAAERGLRPIDAPEQLRACLASRQLIAACVECNEDQLHGLSEELAADYGFDTRLIPLRCIGDANVRDELHRADVLITTSFHAVEVRRIARELGRPFIAVTMRPDLLQGIQDAMQREDVYFVATDERFAEKAVCMFEPSAATHRMHMVLAGRDDLSAIPPRAPTYITRRARSLLKDHPLLTRVPPIGRGFARESMREILTFIVRANAGTRALQA